MNNTGNTTWTQAGGYELIVVADPCSMFTAATFPLGPSDNIAPGTFFDFSPSIQAPAAPTSCTVQMQMWQSGVTFGAVYSETVEIISGINAVKHWADYE